MMFRKDRCLNCDQKSRQQNSLFCAACEPILNSEGVPVSEVEDIIPETMLEPLLGDLRDNKVVYTVPWAMDVDKEGRMWISVDSGYHNEEGGTVTLKIVKQSGVVLVKRGSTKGYKYRKGTLSKKHLYLPCKLVWSFRLGV